MLDAGTFKMRVGILELVAGIALSELEGASGIGVRSDHPEDARKRRNLCKGIKSQLSEGVVTLDLDVNIDYGKDIHEVAQDIQRKVSQTVSSMTALDVGPVNINVVGVNAL